MKNPVTYKEMRWSKWLESMRKDVECTFGIMKGRFRILKIGIRLKKIDSVDQLWCTCCALHNMFLEADGLNDSWEEGMPSEWEGELGYHSDSDISNFTNINDSALDMSGMGAGNDMMLETDNDFTTNNDIEPNIVDPETVLPIIAPDPVVDIRNIKYDNFREKLIEHFDIMFKRNEIKWPTRNGSIEVIL